VVFVITDGTYTDVVDPRPSLPEYAREGKRPGVIAKELADKYDVCFVVVSTADDAQSRKVIENVSSVNPCSIGIPFSKFVDRPEYYTGMLFLVTSTTDVVTVQETRAVGAKVENIQFELNRYELSPESHETLDKLGRFMNAHPDAYAVLAGFSCNLGSQAYNLELSKSRVQKVSQYLENNFNIDSERLVTLWYGKMNPAADNSTEQGRRLNRRVEIAVGGL
jgi:OOP family OmpA-OmpF porin